MHFSWLFSRFCKFPFILYWFYSIQPRRLLLQSIAYSRALNRHLIRPIATTCSNFTVMTPTSLYFLYYLGGLLLILHQFSLNVVDSFCSRLACSLASNRHLIRPSSLTISLDADITSFSGLLRQFCMSLLILYQFPVDLVDSFYGEFACSRAFYRPLTRQVSSTIAVLTPKSIQFSWPSMILLFLHQFYFNPFGSFSTQFSYASVLKRSLTQQIPTGHSKFPFIHSTQ